MGRKRAVVHILKQIFVTAVTGNEIALSRLRNSLTAAIRTIEAVEDLRLVSRRKCGGNAGLGKIAGDVMSLPNCGKLSSAYISW